MSTEIKLKVPSEVTRDVVEIDPETKKEVTRKQTVEFVSHGNFEAELIPKSVIETTSRKFADWLIAEYGLTEIAAEETGDGGEPENEFEKQYPADFPERKVFIERGIAFETARNAAIEQLTAIDGIGEKIAKKIMAWAASNPADNANNSTDGGQQ